MPRRKSPISTAVNVTKGTAAIGRMVAGQVARTALTAAGGAVGAVTERAGRGKVPHTSGPAVTPTPAPMPVSPPDLRAVPEPAPVKVHGDPVAPVKKAPAQQAPSNKASGPSPADVAKAAAKKTAAKKAPAKKAAAKKAAAKKAPAKKAAANKTAGAPGDRLPARKTSKPAPKKK